MARGTPVCTDRIEPGNLCDRRWRGPAARAAAGRAAGAFAIGADVLRQDGRGDFRQTRRHRVARNARRDQSRGGRGLRAVPGLPDRRQANWMALMVCAQGASEITQTIFEKRFMHVKEWRLGWRQDEYLWRNGKDRGHLELSGAPVMAATDLRASVSDGIAGLPPKADNESTPPPPPPPPPPSIHLDAVRADEEKLKAGGASIERISDSEMSPALKMIRADARPRGESPPM